MMIAKLSSKGQIVIPADIRYAFQLRAGDIIELAIKALPPREDIF
jgi:AbrB family looped-hinge helix DNA binding protein